MVIPLFSQYKQAPGDGDLKGEELKTIDGHVLGGAILDENCSVVEQEGDADDAPKPKTLRVRSYKKRGVNGWLVFCLIVAILVVVLSCFAFGSFILKRYGGRQRTAWCKVEYKMEPFNYKTHKMLLEQEYPGHVGSNQIPVTDEWIRLNEDSWELESQGEFNYVLVTDTQSDTSALKLGQSVCFIGSRHDFGLPSYQNVQDFLDGLQDKAEILVDHVSEVNFLSFGDDVLSDDMYLEPAIRNLCGGPNIFRYPVSRIDPEADPQIQEFAMAEAMYYALTDMTNNAMSGDISKLKPALERLQEIVMYLPSSEYLATMPNGRVVSIEIVQGNGFTSYSMESVQQMKPQPRGRIADGTRRN